MGGQEKASKGCFQPLREKNRFVSLPLISSVRNIGLKIISYIIDTLYTLVITHEIAPIRIILRSCQICIIMKIRSILTCTMLSLPLYLNCKTFRCVYCFL